MKGSHIMATTPATHTQTNKDLKSRQKILVRHNQPKTTETSHTRVTTNKQYINPWGTERTAASTVLAEVLPVFQDLNYRIQKTLPDVPACH